MDKKVGDQLNVLSNQFESLDGRVTRATNMFSGRSVAALEDVEPHLNGGNLQPNKTANTNLYDRNVVLQELKVIKSELQSIRFELAELRKALTDRDIEVVSPERVEPAIPAIPAKGTSGNSPRPSLITRSVSTEAEPQQYIKKGYFEVRPKPRQPITPTSPPLKVTPPSTEQPVAQKDVPQAAAPPVKPLPVKSPPVAKASQQFAATRRGPEGAEDPLQPPVSKGGALPTKNITAVAGAKYIPEGLSSGVPKYKHISSRVVQALKPTKRLKGDSRIRHKEDHVTTLMRSETDSFVQRNKKLKRIESLKRPARQAETFEQNSDNRSFMRFLLDPAKYYENQYFSKTVSIPKSEFDGTFTHREVDLDERIEQEINSSDDPNMKRDQALTNVAQKIAGECKPYKDYIVNKQKLEERNQIKAELILNKEVYKKDIREARDVKYSEELDKSDLLNQLAEKHKDLMIDVSWPKNKDTFDKVLEALTTKEDALKKVKTEVKFSRTGLKAARISQVINKILPFRRSARRKSDEQVRMGEEDKLAAKMDIVAVEKSIVEVRKLQATLKQYDWAAESLIKDLDYSVIRKDKPDSEFDDGTVIKP